MGKRMPLQVMMSRVPQMLTKQMLTKQMLTKQMLRRLLIPELVPVASVDLQRVIHFNARVTCWSSIGRCAVTGFERSGALMVQNAVFAVCLFKNVLLPCSDASAGTRKHL
jgi:hypothetical protein